LKSQVNVALVPISQSEQAMVAARISNLPEGNPHRKGEGNSANLLSYNQLKSQENVARLSPSEQAMVSARIANLPEGQRPVRFLNSANLQSCNSLK
jgi:hypothetical protein